jgi:hypothetical protein
MARIASRRFPPRREARPAGAGVDHAVKTSSSLRWPATQVNVELFAHSFHGYAIRRFNFVITVFHKRGVWYISARSEAAGLSTKRHRVHLRPRGRNREAEVFRARVLPKPRIRMIRRRVEFAREVYRAACNSQIARWVEPVVGRNSRRACAENEDNDSYEVRAKHIGRLTNQVTGDTEGGTAGGRPDWAPGRPWQSPSKGKILIRWVRQGRGPSVLAILLRIPH